MRAHWVKFLIDQPEYVLKGESLHHLVNVIRIESGEELLLLNGQGLSVLTKIEAINKKEMKLIKLSSEIHERGFQFDLALGMPKREALELCLKEACELGFRKIYLIRSDYSQMKAPDTERMDKLLVSALEQSNAPYLPLVLESKWSDVPWDNYHEALLMDSQSKINTTSKTKQENENKLLIIGPEGGFSPEELSLLHGQEVIKVVNLPTPILRTPTALATGAGLMMISLLK